MQRFFDRLPDSNALELVLRRVAFGARLVGLGWWAVLAALTGLGRSTRREVIYLSVALAIVWSLVTIVAYRRRPDLMTARGVLTIDTGLAVAALLAPAAAGIPQTLFYGGFPFIVVVLAATRSRVAAWTVAGVLGLVVVSQLQTSLITTYASQVLVYAVGAFIVTWSVNLLRRFDAERAKAQTELVAAESARGRAEAHATISAHLHDSVLQTLALIQRSAEVPAEVVSLARGQERELRDWLYASPTTNPAGLVELVSRAAAEVEARYQVTVEVVAVGGSPEGAVIETPRPETAEAVAAAAREAMVNSARHSGSGTVSVYLEMVDGAVRIYVRDRGTGFEPERVAADRHGIADSIRGRLAAVGGSAELRTAVGKGTEWMLEVSK